MGRGPAGRIRGDTDAGSVLHYSDPPVHHSHPPPDPTLEHSVAFTPIHTDQAPAAIGTYSQAVRAGNTVYLSGQIPLDPQTMEIVTGEVEVHVRRVFDNLRAVARAAGGDLSNAVKLNVYLTDLGNFQTVNKVMGEYFTQPYPARAAIGVSALPRGAVVEVDAVLVL
jgi:reactive intermediate/imine deaminase